MANSDIHIYHAGDATSKCGRAEGSTYIVTSGLDRPLIGSAVVCGGAVCDAPKKSRNAPKDLPRPCLTPAARRREMRREMEPRAVLGASVACTAGSYARPVCSQRIM